MKSAVLMLLIPLTALIFAGSASAPMALSSSVVTTVEGQHGRPTQTPTPASPGTVPPGNTGGAHRVADASGAATYPTASEGPGEPNIKYEQSPGAAPRGDYDRSLQLYEKAIRIPMGDYEQGLELGNTEGPRRPKPIRLRKVYGAFSAASPAEFLQPCDSAERLENKLSGVYLGNIDFEGLAWRGNAALRICGNEFSLVTGGKQANGKVAFVTASGYTAAAFRFTEVPDFEVPSPTWPRTVSVRVSRAGGSMSFRSAPGETSKFAFTGSSERRPRSNSVMRRHKL
jgi:hypothetical protein